MKRSNPRGEAVGYVLTPLTGRRNRLADLINDFYYMTLTTMNPIRVLLADDHKRIRAGLRLVVDQQPDLSVSAKLTMEGKRWNWQSPRSPMLLSWILECRT